MGICYCCCCCFTAFETSSTLKHDVFDVSGNVIRTQQRVLLIFFYWIAGIRAEHWSTEQFQNIKQDLWIAETESREKTFKVWFGFVSFGSCGNYLILDCNLLNWCSLSTDMWKIYFTLPYNFPHFIPTYMNDFFCQSGNWNWWWWWLQEEEEILRIYYPTSYGKSTLKYILFLSDISEMETCAELSHNGLDFILAKFHMLFNLYFF